MDTKQDAQREKEENSNQARTAGEVRTGPVMTINDNEPHVCPKQSHVTLSPLIRSPFKLFKRRPRGFVCRYCGLIFSFRDQREQHIQNKHEATAVFRCWYCKKCFRSKTSWQQHSVFHLSHLFCSVCHKKLRDSEQLKEHREKVLSNKLNRELCDKMSNTQANIRDRDKRKRHSKKVVCEVCNMFVSCLTAHYKKYHHDVWIQTKLV